MVTRTVNGVACVFIPLNAIAGAKLAHKVGRALAKSGELSPLVAQLGAKKTAGSPATAPKEASDTEGLTEVIALAELILGAIDTDLASELLTVADNQTAIDGKRKQFDAVFEGDIYSVFACVYHVLDASGFFAITRASA